MSADSPKLAIVGVDTGGTFTDLVAWVGGRLAVHKVLSTPDDPARAVLQGLSELLGSQGAAVVTYGTTVATNALLERRGAHVVLLTTAGFEDIIEIGRQNRPDLYDPEPQRPPPLVARHDRIGVAERVLPGGTVLLRLSARALTRALAEVDRRRPEAVAVCFLHAYANPVHEQRVGDALRTHGYTFVSLSHALANEHREYERCSTAVTNAYVQPVVQRHLHTLAKGLPRHTRLRVLQSNGGAISPTLAAAEAVRTCLSGPAGGVRGAWTVARALGFRRAISFDMGGTSTDVSLLDGGVALTTEWSIAGCPLKVPAVDVHTVGAGGGSIAYVDAGGLLKVGPLSAGADPGPACYGRGTEPTVTDANVLLGRLAPEAFLGGRMRLLPERARAALARLARRVGGRPEDVAAGVVSVVNAGMERAIRAVSIERGQDPRTCALVAFGGAAGQHACDLAASLDIATVVIPELPGLLSAWGAIQAPTERDAVASLLWRDPDFERLDRLAADLTLRVRQALAAEGVPPARQHVSLQVEVRYAGQSHELTVPLGPDYRQRFERTHQRWYGYVDPQRSVEVVNLRVFGRERVRPLPRAVAAAPAPAHTPARRRVYHERRWLTVPTWARHDLPERTPLHGPLLVVELSATTWVPPGWTLLRHATGHLVLTRHR